MTDIWHDIRFALRQTCKRPLFSATCVLLLALGLGANTAIFSVLYAAVLEPLPYPDPDRLVAVVNRFPLFKAPRLGVSALEYLELREHHEVFSNSAAFTYVNLARSGVENPTNVDGISATSSLFATLGARPLLGRFFNDQEERYEGAPHAVVLGENYWKSDFGGDPKILSRTLELNGEIYPIIGVMPRWFQFEHSDFKIWVPLTFAGMLQPKARTLRIYLMYARLAPGLTSEQASAALNQVSYRSSLADPADYPYSTQGWRFSIQSLAHSNESDRIWIFTLFAAASCLVLIVAANIAGLLAVRSTERQFEVSLRLTLGANRWQIARQVLIEVMLLAVAGGVAALFVANVSRQMLAKYSPLPVTNARSEIAIVLFELFLCLITGLACAAIPAWMASRTDPGLRLQEGGHQRTAAASKNLLRHGFVVGQVAVATTLLVCGGLFLHSILRLLAAPLGFNPQNVLTMRISIPRALYLTPESRQRFYTSVIDSVGRTPGVASASGCDTLPFGWDDATEVTFEIVGKERGTAQSIAVNDVYPGYFATLDIPLLRGRTFNSNDRAGAEPVAVIDQAAREQFFHEQDPVGQLIKFEVGNAFKVIGVTGAIKSAALDLKSRPTIYLSALTGKPRNLYLLVRSSLPQAALLSAIQRAVVNVDKDRPVYDVLPLQTRIDNALETRRFVVSLVTLFAALGAVLAGLGLYALLSHTILLRKREIGIRVALGATRLDVASFVARVGTSPVILGILGGSFSAFAAQRFIQSQLYATSMGDSAAWSAALFTVVLASASAIAIPVWRAVHFDAQQAMREE